MYPSLPILLKMDVMGYVAVIALVSGALGAFYPAYRAAQQDPVEALMYE
jgi:ABC-type lipoprotein release transport system permease subunit